MEKTQKQLLNLEKDLQMDDIMASAEIIPIIGEGDESMLLGESEVPEKADILPLRDNVLFPGELLPVTLGRIRSKKTVEEAQKRNSIIAVVTQKDAKVDDPSQRDLYRIGCTARVVKMFNVPGKFGTMAVLQGMTRVSISDVEVPESPSPIHGMLNAVPELLPLNKKVFENKTRLLRRMFKESLKRKGMEGDPRTNVTNIGSDRLMINIIAGHLEADAEGKQMMLEATGYEDRVDMVLDFLHQEKQYLDVKEEVQRKAQHQMDRQQKEFMLNQQMKVIQEELGGPSMNDDLENLQERAEWKKWSQEVADIFERELNKLSHCPMQSPDYTVQLNYLNEMLDMPWNEYTKDNTDIERAQKVLDHDHFGLEKVKERIVEQIAVMRMKGDMKSPILCLVGPPGTGKTSLGKSIAASLGRKYVRVALGGLHDEAEVRGHRKTYVGAMPGRIMKGIKRAGSSNPVFILDEIDKVQSQTNQGDPTSALLEVLDPEQNNAFHDNFLDVDFDLSHVMFIATANSKSTIQPALLDRMEVIDLEGYILEEKLEIAKNHLLPRLLKENGLNRGQIKIGKPVMTRIINDYTRESGVRQLEKALARIVRKLVVGHFDTLRTLQSMKVEERDLRELLGLPIHNSEKIGPEPRVGVVTGLAWTSVGGEILFVESSLSKGKGTLNLTGNLGDVMKESATLAWEYLKCNAERFGVKQEDIEGKDVYVHVPEGAVPKDGPSAGITLFVAMLSAFTGRRVKNDWAMTGEITLRGSVTPVGGIKEKILAAKRAGVTHIMLSRDNQRDIEDIEQTYLSGLTFHYISEIGEAVDLVMAD